MTQEHSGKRLHIASYQEKLPDKEVRCLLCPHFCLLKDRKIGICRTRINRHGSLYSLAYGNPCSLAVDPIEKKPLFHFHPGTEILSLAMEGCNLRCLNCQNWEISQTSPKAAGLIELMPEDIVQRALHKNIGSIAFTYTEPTVFFEYIFDTAKLAHEVGLKTVMVSNGYINEKPLLDLCTHLDAANIDLKCFDDTIYRHLTGGKLQPVLETLKTLKAQNVWLEITNLLIPGVSDHPDMIQSMCDWLIENGFEDTPLHFSRFFPRYKMMDISPTSEQSLILAKEIAVASGMKFVYVGNIPQLKGEDTFCPNCKKMVVERRGYLVRQNLIKDGKCIFCGKKISGVWY